MPLYSLITHFTIFPHHDNNHINNNNINYNKRIKRHLTM
jgi:hypothetical protein